MYLNVCIWLTQYFCNSDHLGTSICETVITTKIPDTKPTPASNEQQPSNLHSWRERTWGNQPAKTFSCDTHTHTHTHKALSATVASPEGDTPPGSSILSVLTISVSLSVLYALSCYTLSQSPTPPPPHPGTVLTPSRRARWSNGGLFFNMKGLSPLEKKDKQMPFIEFKRRGNNITPTFSFLHLCKGMTSALCWHLQRQDHQDFMFCLKVQTVCSILQQMNFCMYLYWRTD